MALYYEKVDPVDKNKYQGLLPLTDVSLKGTLAGPIASYDVQLSYANLSEESPIECTFEFPISNKLCITKLTAMIGDKMVEAKIREKEEAKVKYDDAIAAGNTAVFAEQTKKNDAVALLIGNLLPGQEAVLNVTIVEQIDIMNGSYLFTIPAYFTPNYKKHAKGDGSLLEPTYTFNYDLTIKSD